jgi:hypothetical protein
MFRTHFIFGDGGGDRRGVQVMSQSEYEAAVRDFIRTRGITRCPTACVVKTQGMVSLADREALQQRAAEFERLRLRRRAREPRFGPEE